ncbi:MAG: M14 family zinc carboxypeptidase [Bacteroidia bacterium]|nr:M14 family zinc carboxypeptidase [Bacteroidia bacterium]
MTKKHIFPILLVAAMLPSMVASSLHAQQFSPEEDPCGHHLLSLSAHALLWGYGLDTLEADMQRWTAHPWVRMDTIGLSVQGRPLLHIALTNPSSMLPKKRIWIHARTHPIEAESSWLTRAIVNELLSASPLAAAILDHCIVNILPMLNPDGVQLGNARENANGVDIESNWGAATPQPEVRALRAQLTSLMQSPSPVGVALNLHSAYQCRRYFVYHDPAGTSELFATLQQRFIGMVRSRFPGGIEPYDYFVTWTGGTPDRYPESWFWMNFRENVMALTYEDMNCVTAGEYDRTAFALLGGAAEYLGIVGSVGITDEMASPAAFAITAVYPQPFSASGGGRLFVRVTVPESGRHVRIHVLDALGRTVAQLWDGQLSGDRVLAVSGEGLSTGVHFVRLAAGDEVRMQPIQILR